MFGLHKDRVKEIGVLMAIATPAIFLVAFTVHYRPLELVLMYISALAASVLAEKIAIKKGWRNNW